VKGRCFVELTDSHQDCCTLSNYLSIRTTSIHLDLTITFPSVPSVQGIISGIAKHSLVADKPVDHVIFDTSFLKINKIFSGTNPLQYTLAKRKEPYGSALTIQLPKELQKDETTEVSVEYETTESCTAVQWLTAEQTFGGKYPFMYTLSISKAEGKVLAM
jgi:leukotriene-A4 hydrolase